jgi:hypothetical protein
MPQPLINGRAYDYSQITFIIEGVPVSGISKISYKEEQPVEGNKGAGEYDVSVGLGGISCSGSIEISMNDVEALRDVAPTRGSLLSLPFSDIICVFGNPQKVQTHTLKNTKFKNDGVDSSTGDTDIKMTFDIYISHIIYR